MKNKLITIIMLLTAISCTKPGDKFFNGKGRIGGVILFDNILNGRTDTAKTAKVTLTQAQTNVQYTRQLTDGNYAVGDLKDGTYTLKISYQLSTNLLSRSVTYSWTTKSVVITNGAFKPDSVIHIPADSASYGGTALRLLVKNEQQAAIPNTQVCLYTSGIRLAANRNNCTQSIASGTTDKYGIVIFDKLDEVTYYANAYLVSGKDTLSNKTTDQTALTPLKVGTISLQTVTIKASDPALPATSLRVTVTDAYGANISGVNLCLYSDPTLIQKYKDCTGSLQSTVSNSNGVAVFSGLQSLSYYVSAYKQIGKDTLSNGTTKLQTTGNLKANTETPFHVVIK